LQASRRQRAEAQAIVRPGSWEWNFGSGTLSGSDEFYHLFGAGKDTLTDIKSVFDHLHPDDRAMAQSGMRKVLHARRAFAAEFRVILPDGHSRNLQAHGRIVTGKKGVAVRMLGTCRDVSECQQAEREGEAIRLLQILNANTDRREMLRSVTSLLLDCSGCEAVGIRLRDGEDYPYYEAIGFPTDVPRKGCCRCTFDPLGRLPRETTGDAVRECMCDEVLSGKFDPARPFFTPKGSFWCNGTTELLAGTNAARRANRCNCDGYESVALIPLHAGNATLGLLQFNDRRANRFSPEAIARLERIAEQVANALARRITEEQTLRLNRDLIQKNAELEQIVFVASHDLRSPLVCVQGFGRRLADARAEIVGLMARAEPRKAVAGRIAAIIDQEMPEALSRIQRSVLKMDVLLSGLLRLSRFGHAALRIETLEVRGIVADVVDDFKYTCREKGAQIAIADALPRCRGDAGQINQVFSNLIDNALKYLDPTRPGRIFISGTTEGKEVHYCVEDNGIGMDPEHCEKAFEIFQRLNPGDGIAGEGLGLTIVRRILLRQNGKIWVKAAPGRGAKFFVSLPADRGGT
jgi:PAS domain S-box-containing protein